MPFLVVTQALPGAGKTVITRFLEQECGFARLCLEEYLMGKLGRGWWVRVKGKDDFWWQSLYENRVFHPTEQSLKEGKSMAIDTTAGATKWMVNHYRIQELFLRGGKAEKYILEIQANPEIRHQRIAQRHGISLKAAKKWDENYVWKRRWQPANPGVAVLQYTNNTHHDLERIKKDLRGRFKRVKAVLL